MHAVMMFSSASLLQRSRVAGQRGTEARAELRSEVGMPRVGSPISAGNAYCTSSFKPTSRMPEDQVGLRGRSTPFCVVQGRKLASSSRRLEPP